MPSAASLHFRGLSIKELACEPLEGDPQASG